MNIQKIREAKRHAQNVDKMVGWVEEEATGAPASDEVVKDLVRAALQKTRELLDKLREISR